MRRFPASARAVARPPFAAVALSLAVATVLVLAFLAGGLAAGHGINHLGADPQGSADGVVLMESVFATEDGFVVVYRDRDGGSGEVLASRPFSASTRDVKDVPVRIPAAAWADLPANATLRAALHGDDGDGEFDPATDPPLTSFGGVAGDTFVLRRGTTAYVGASSGGGIQRSADGNVEIRTVRLPERGYVVLRNSSGGDPAEVVGVTPLSAGRHANVSVDLEEGFFADRAVNATFSVWAVVYVDDGDGTFDDGDRPIHAGEAVVGTRFGIRKLAPGRTPTPTPDEGSVVVTPTRSVDPGSETPTDTPEPSTPTLSPTAGPPSITHSPSPAASRGTSGAGPGFGPWLALVALAALTAGAHVRRWR